ncbi:MAG: diacylglycerol kinase family protein [Bacilli bacterium]|nr:diacylglycerol kinase family protein [Bacilli bacterium]
MKYILFNELSNNKKGKETLDEYIKSLEEPYEAISVIGLDYSTLLPRLTAEDSIVLVGGDGTLNHFINDVDCDALENDVYFLAAGTGNDFLNDVGNGERFIKINQYIKNLPVVEINDKTYKFINGVGFGIDGWCCEEGDRQRAKSDKPVNYTSIAISGLLFKFKRRKAVVIVDGKEYVYKHAWLAPAMKGRFYGGGMQVAPTQDRLAEDPVLTNVVYTGKSKILTLIKFPNIFKGTLQKFKTVHTVSGKCIEVKFDKPCAAQIDGETILNVTSYKAHY